MAEKNEMTKKEQVQPELSKKIPQLIPAVDIYENEEEILLHADLPGVEREDLSLNVDNGKLFLSGYRKVQGSGSEQYEEFTAVEYRRVFSIPQTIDATKVVAELNKGVLILHLPKSEAAKPKKIEIKAA